MEDFIVLNAGYQTAIKDSLEILKDLQDFDIIKDRLLRLSDKERAINDKVGYSGNISKYYDAKNDLGYILYDDIYGLNGIMLFVSKKEYKKIEEKELIFVKNNMKPFTYKNYNDKDLIYKEYQEMLNGFKEI